MDDKTFFKEMKKEVKDYSEDITEGFPYFCLQTFWDELSAEEVIEALEGLSVNDDSVDAFFIDHHSKEINILQCKSCESEKKRKALRKEWMDYLNAAPGKLKDDSYIDAHKNTRIKEIAKEYKIHDRRGYKTKLHFFHLGRGSENVLKYYRDTILYHSWDDIKDEYEEYLSKLDRTEPPYVEMTLELGIIEPKINNKHKTFVSFITGDEVIKLRKLYRYKLFDKNLRFGLGKNKINSAIMKTAQGEPGNFYFYNNGITITSKGFKYKPTNSRVRIDYPQIINGAQTVNAIYEAYKTEENKLSRKESSDASTMAMERFKEIKILFRVIQDKERGGKKSSEFEENVIRYNNSQNAIKETDFYANEPEQIELQKVMAKFGYFYEIKRGDRKYMESGREEHTLLGKRKRDFVYWDEKIGIEKLASLWMAYYNEEPTLDKVQKSNIFGHAGDRHYSAIFEQADKVTEELVKEMILAYNLFEVISQQTEIYGSRKKEGLIIPKVSKFNEGSSDADFDNIQKIVSQSFLFGRMVRERFTCREKFIEKKQEVFEQVSKYAFFSMGKYLTLSIFGLILKECGYKNALINESNLFSNKEFIKSRVVRPWLKAILDNVVREEYEEFGKNSGQTVRAFYRRSSTWENVQTRFNRLEFSSLDKPYREIFPLDLIVPVAPAQISPLTR